MGQVGPNYVSFDHTQLMTMVLTFQGRVYLCHGRRRRMNGLIITQKSDADVKKYENQMKCSRNLSDGLMSLKIYIYKFIREVLLQFTGPCIVVVLVLVFLRQSYKTLYSESQEMWVSQQFLLSMLRFFAHLLNASRN